MSRCSLFFVLFLAALARGEEDIVFACPEAATADSATQAASALKNRCEVWGYLGMTTRSFVRDREGKEVAEAVDGCRHFVSISCATGFTEPMRRRIVAMAAIAAKTLEMRLIRNSSAAEEEQFPHGAWDRPEDDRAPPGAAWHRMVRWDFAPDVAGEPGKQSGPMVLMNDERAVAPGDLIDWRRTDGPPDRRKYTIHVGGDSAKRVSKWIQEGPAGTTWRLCLLVDGKAMNLGEMIASIGLNGTVHVTLAYDHGRWIRAMALHPLPFALTPAK